MRSTVPIWRRPAASTTALCAAVLAVAAANACSNGGGSGSESAGVGIALLEQPSFAEGVTDLGVESDVSAPGELGEQLGDRIASSIVAMDGLDVSAYQERFGREQSRQALLLGRVVGSIESSLPAAIERAGDGEDAERDALAFGLAAAWSISGTFDSGASAEERVRVIAPRAIRDDHDLANISNQVAGLLDNGRSAAAANVLLGAFPALDPADVVAEIADELTGEIPADHLSSFLSSFDVTSTGEQQ